jgi:ComF family protein
MRTLFNQILAKSPLCLCCGYQKTHKHGFCLGCYHDLPHIKTPCLQCGLPLLANTSCTCKAEDWPFSVCLSATSYSFPIDKLLWQFKNQARLSLCQPLGELLAAQIQRQQHPLPQVLMPVPLHPNKLKQRGFNQSLELAKVLSKQLHIPVDYHSLQSTHQTTQQKTLNKQQRLVNVQTSYALTRPLSATHIALIDDVITTGATTKTLAYILREQGATQIQAWSIARTASFLG